MDSQSQLLAAALEAQRRDLHVAMPGRVERYDLDLDVADIQPMIQRMVPGADEESDAPIYETLPVLPSVPILRMRSGGFYLSTPIRAGDFVMLLFCERDIAQWRQSGQISNPGDQRMHPLSAACAIPGIYPAADRLTNLHDGDGGTRGALFAHEDGFGIELRSNSVRVGNLSDEIFTGVAREDLVESELNKIKTALDGLASAIPATNSYITVGNVGSTKLRVGT